MEPIPVPQDFLTATEAAGELGVSDQTVLNWRSRGAFPGATRLGKIWRIPRAEVERVKREGLDFAKLEQEAA